MNIQDQTRGDAMEQRIREAHARWMADPGNRDLWQQFTALHAQRSQSQIKRMETECGIG